MAGLPSAAPEETSAKGSLYEFRHPERRRAQAWILTKELTRAAVEGPAPTKPHARMASQNSEARGALPARAEWANAPPTKKLIEDIENFSRRGRGPSTAARETCKDKGNLSTRLRSG